MKDDLQLLLSFNTAESNKMANYRKRYRDVIPLTFVLRQEVLSRFNAGQCKYSRPEPSSL